jgi:hypothetical protein
MFWFNKKVSVESLLYKSSSLAVALGKTKFVFIWSHYVVLLKPDLDV